MRSFRLAPNGFKHGGNDMGLGDATEMGPQRGRPVRHVERDRLTSLSAVS
ncbi:hypothetical protein [Bosea sp. (in: a-proteobacteria)]